MSPSTASQPVSFHDAVERLRALLRTQKLPDTVLWIANGDLIAAQSRLYVFVRNPDRRWIAAQCKYDTGVDRNMGIVLKQVCQAPGVSCCQVHVPSNSAPAVARNGLQFEVPPEVRRATPVTSRLRWRWLKMTGRPGL